ncbi:MAG TPA: hypothetical protein VGF97_08800 [Rhizomicrobium sp.]|jgi:hypothetical protein
MKKLFLILSGACLLCASAEAATTLSGNYAVQYIQSCQVVVNIDKTTGTVAFDKQSTDGFNNSSPGVIAFDQADGTFTWNGTTDAVSVVLEQFSDGTKKGKEGQSAPFGESGAWSNTDTTLTIDGSVYDVVYSGIDGGGVAHGFMAALHLPLKHLPANHCVVTLQGQAQ